MDEDRRYTRRPRATENTDEGMLGWILGAALAAGALAMMITIAVNSDTTSKASNTLAASGPATAGFVSRPALAPLEVR